VNMQSNIVEVIGFDLGHGETAVAKANMRENVEPKMLEIFGKKSQVTAIGRHPKTESIMIGEMATTLEGVENLDVCFKTSALNDPQARRSIRAFFQTCYKHLVHTHQVRGNGETYLAVGCPSAWKNMSYQDHTLLKEYQHLLSFDNTLPLKVIPESRAAFMQAREGGAVTINELKATVLVIDLGSSTTDITRVKGTSSITPYDFGIPLGASVIDYGILWHSLSSPLNSDRDELIKLFEKRADLKAKALLACREAKEKFFRHPPDMREDPDLKVIIPIDFQYVFTFRAVASRAVIRKILSKPLRELGNRSWEKQFSQLLEWTRQKLEKEGDAPSVILFTGGASRMDFIIRIARKIFPEKNIRITVDDEPAYAIAKGLAYVGRWDLRTTEFMDAVDRFCQEEIPAIVSEYETHLLDRLVTVLAENILNFALKQGIIDWMEQRVRALEDLDSHVETLVKQWIKSEQGMRAIFDACKVWFKPILREITGRTDQICRKYFLEAGSLHINPTLKFEDFKVGMKVGSLDFVESAGIIVGIIVSIAIASVLGGSGIALVYSGPVGWLVGLIVALPFGGFLAGRTEKFIRRADLPRAVRQTVVSKHAIENKIKDRGIRAELEDEIRTAVMNSRSDLDKMVENLTAELQRELHKKANDVRILIP